MSEKPTGDDANVETEPKVNDWHEVVKLPIATPEKPWSLDGLEDLFRESIEVVTIQSLKDNHGIIYTTLSGGVDSSLCLAIIAELCPPETEIHTFTAGGSKKHPDIQFARKVAELFNTTHHEIIVNPKDKEQIIREFTDFYGDSPQTKTMIERADINVWAVYHEIAKTGAKSVIAHDGIDELMGGYWLHRQSAIEGREGQEEVFRKFWGELEPEHLIPLESTAHHFGIQLLFPYLQKRLVEYIAHIPVNERASFASGKIPLKEIARKYVWPKEVVDRKKRGFVDALMEE